MDVAQRNELWLAGLRLVYLGEAELGAYLDLEHGLTYMVFAADEAGLRQVIARALATPEHEAEIRAIDLKPPVAGLGSAEKLL